MLSEALASMCSGLRQNGLLIALFLYSSVTTVDQKNTERWLSERTIISKLVASMFANCFGMELKTVSTYFY